MAKAGENGSAGPSAAGAPSSAQEQARILAEALPHLIRYDEQTVVIKFGGHAMGDEALADAFAKDIVYLKQSGVNPIVVHGGGPQIAAMLKKLAVFYIRMADGPVSEEASCFAHTCCLYHKSCDRTVDICLTYSRDTLVI